MEISTDMKKVKESKCFGIAWDGEVKECKICEVATICKQRTLGGVKQAPDTKPTAKKVENEDVVSTMKPSNPRPEPKNDSKAEVKEEKASKSKKTSPAKSTLIDLKSGISLS